MPIPPRHKPWAYQALLNLNQEGMARAELTEAGVAQHRIDALYPVSFTDLIPGLEQHLIDLGGEHMYLRGDLPHLNSLFEAIKQNLWVDQFRRHQADLEADLPRLGILRDYLSETWEESHSEQRPRFAVLHPMWLWSAWWSMVNFEELTQEAQQSSSKLLVSLDEAWHFPRGIKHV